MMIEEGEFELRYSWHHNLIILACIPVCRSTCCRVSAWM